jgi:hypothetical protein
VVDSEPSFQLADSIQSELKNQAKVINEKRLEFTRPIDAMKKKWMEFFNPAVEDRTKAAEIYQAKMTAFRRQEREKAETARRQAEDWPVRNGRSSRPRPAQRNRKQPNSRPRPPRRRRCARLMSYDRRPR